MNNRPLRRVLELAEIGRGRFFIDRDATAIWIADDPRKVSVEISVAQQAFRSYFTNATDVTIRGLIVEKFANEGQSGAIQAIGGWTIEENEVRLNHAVGIEGGRRVNNNNVHHNGQLGIKIDGFDRSIVAGNNIHHNNYARYSLFWESGGAKFLNTTRLTVRGNWTHHNLGSGLWTDWDNVNTLYENNVAEYNAGSGIGHEASYEAAIVDNVIRGNGFGQRFSRGFDGAGIQINTSQRVEIAENILTDNRNGIGVVSYDRGEGTYGRHATKGVSVHDNSIASNASIGATGLASGDPADYESNNNRFEENRYAFCRPGLFAWRNPNGLGYAYVTWDEWIAAGNDTTGSFDIRPGC